MRCQKDKTNQCDDKRKNKSMRWQKDKTNQSDNKRIKQINAMTKDAYCTVYVWGGSTATYSTDVEFLVKAFLS